MPTAIIRKKIARPIVGYKDIDPKTTYAPFNVELRNGRIDVLGNWIGRPGYGGSIDIGVDEPIHFLIAEENGIAITGSGKVYTNIVNNPANIPDSGLSGFFRPTSVKYGDRILIAEGGGIIKLENGVMSTIPDAPENARFLGRVGSYTMWAEYGTTKFGWSAVSNPESYPAANFANVKQTGLIYFALDHNDLFYIYKDDSIEVWYNRGGDAPIVRVKAQSIWNAGTKSPAGVVKANNTIYWPDTDGDFKVLPGEIISGPYRAYFDDKITREDWNNCYGFDCRQESVVRWFFPASGICIVYDYRNNRMYEENKWSGSGWQLLPWNSYMELNGKQYIGDIGNTGLVFEWSKKYKTDNGDPIRTLREFKIEAAGGLRARISVLELQLKRGVGNSDEPDPEMILRTRTNESNRWNERVISLGKVGQNNPYIRLNSFGIGNEITLQLIITDAAERLIEEMWLTAIPMVR